VLAHSFTTKQGIEHLYVLQVYHGY